MYRVSVEKKNGWLSFLGFRETFFFLEEGELRLPKTLLSS